MNEDTDNTGPGMELSPTGPLLLSSILYAIGSVLVFAGQWLIFNMPPFQMVYRVVGAVGCLFLVLHAMLEMRLDVNMGPRSITHMRYREKPLLEDDNATLKLNLWQSTVFGLGALFQGIALLSPLRPLLWLQLIASLLYLDSSILIYISRGRRDCCCCCGETDPPTTLDRLGNAVFTAASVLLFLGALDQLRNSNEFLGAFLIYGSSFLLAISGLAYFMADTLRHCQTMNERRVRQQEYRQIE